MFHGGSGSTADEIAEALSYGVIKMNIDTDLQWAFWDGIRGYEADKHDYLQGQLGNPNGPDAPNKKQYDPRVWLRAGEESFVTRLEQAFAELHNVGTLASPDRAMSAYRRSYIAESGRIPSSRPALAPSSTRSGCQAGSGR